MPRVEDVNGGNGILLLADTTALHGAFYFRKSVGEEDEIVLDLPGFGKFDAKLLLVDVVDKFRAIVSAIVELEGKVVSFAKVVGVADFDVLLLASLYPILAFFATGYELVQRSQDQGPKGFKHIGLASPHHDDAAMAYFRASANLY